MFPKQNTLGSLDLSAVSHAHRPAQFKPLSARVSHSLELFLGSFRDLIASFEGHSLYLGGFTVFRWILVRFFNSFRIRPRSAFLELHFHLRFHHAQRRAPHDHSNNFLIFRTLTLIDYDAARFVPFSFSLSSLLC